MDNGIDKKALFKFKSEPYLRPISDLKFGFYNLDENTAKLRFQLYNKKGNLLLSENNINAYAYFESANGSATDVEELEIIDELNGIVGITLSKEFLEASTSTKVKGQVYIGVNNVENNPDYNEVAVFREFTFEVKDALINKISSFTKIEYIRMFDQLKMRIEQQVKDIEEAIANGADYVAEMQSVLQRGVETLNAIVADGKTDIQSFINQAKSDLDSTKESAMSDITTTSNNAKTSVNETADGVIKNINNVSDDVTKHVDDKLIEFNGLLETGGFLTPEELGNQLGELEWQKHKITEDDGTTPLISDFDFNNPEEILKYSAGTYYVRKANNHSSNNIIGNYGYLSINTTYANKNVATLTFIPIGTSVLNTTSVYMCKKNGEWGDWIEVTNNQYDTGWVTFDLINGAKSNTAFKDDGDDGFDCAYRTITNGSKIEKRVRINASNLTHLQQIAKLPKNFAKNVQFHYVRVPINCGYGLVGIYPNGNVYVYIESDKRADWNSSSNGFYFYGEISWVE